jgi:shikimate dehydrogenase
LNEFLNSSSATAGPHRIGGATKVCAVIGDPIEHTLSPPMHNAAFRSLGMDYVYVAFRIRRDQLARAIAGFRALGIVGVNVTRPHKTSILRFLDGIERNAREIGAVNTVVNADGTLRGYNTDGQAAFDVLQGIGGSLSDKKVVILGAGGAARAITHFLSKTVPRISMLNRTRSRGSKLAAEIARRSKAQCRAYGLSKADLRKEVPEADLVINTLPVDIFPRFGAILIQEELIRPGMIVFDANYVHRSDFLVDAERAGATVTDGLEMLVRQAALSFKLWTGREPPIDVMRAAANEAKGGWTA